MSNIMSQRCFIHNEREAAVLCPECRNYFCRECVTEHDDRMLCARCLHRYRKTPILRRFRIRYLQRAGLFLLGIMIAWLFFYYLGEAIHAIPVSFHEETIWQKSAAEGK